jgi:4-amino-4-deoxy-L-arabinose transferase-like glycosyltransferase
MYFPIVVLVAILPGLYALRNWDLTPPGPWWGMRGLAVLEGRALDQSGMDGVGSAAEAEAFRAVAYQPPLYAWLESAGLWLTDRSPVTTVLPSYLAGAAVVLLVFFHGRLWRGPGLGLAAAVLTGFNRDLLVQMQQATPATLGLLGLLLALLAYGHYLRAEGGGRVAWVVVGGLGLGLSLLSVGLAGLLIVPVVGLHQAFLGPDPWAQPRKGLRRWLTVRSGLMAAGSGLLIALVLAAPWHLWMYSRHGAGFMQALLAPPYSGVRAHLGLLGRLLMLAPASVPLGLFAAFRAGRRVLLSDGDDPLTVGGAFWVGWLAVSAVVPALLPKGPGPVLSLMLLVPLNLLASQAMLDLAGRRIPARALVWLAPATALAVAWWGIPELRQGLASLATHRGLEPSTALGLHLGLDLIVVLALATRAVDRWARRRDDRRRVVLGGFLGTVVALTVTIGLREVEFRHRETSDLLALRDAVLRRQALRPFSVAAVVGPAPDSGYGHRPGQPAPIPGGRLRFLLRATLPELRQTDLIHEDDLHGLPQDGPWLVILAGPSERLSYPMQSRLALEAIHPGRAGVLAAYASATDANKGDVAVK